MKTKIIFVINSIQNPRCIKRVNEFIDMGYDVNAYAFNRGDSVFNDDVRFEINVLETYSNDLSYVKRLPILYNSIKSIVKENKNAVYYLFGLEVAMMFKFVTSKHAYIYEESDLVHTYLPNKFLRTAFDKIDKYFIRKSLMTVFTSEGFVRYHFGAAKPGNCFVIPNRLSPSIKQYDLIQKVKSEKLRIGFVGKIRFDSVKSFAEIFCQEYTNAEFHFFGSAGSIKEKEMFDPLKKYSNCIFHGPFKNPADLPQIYSQIDLVLSTYDVEFDNVRYAEPNKIYESIYFETPIIVSEGCFLGDKVKELNIGFTVNALDKIAVKQLIDSLTLESVNGKIESIKRLGKDCAINNNEAFYQILNQKIADIIQC